MRSTKRRGVKEALRVTLSSTSASLKRSTQKNATAQKGEQQQKSSKKSCLLLAASPEGLRLPGMDMAM